MEKKIKWGILGLGSIARKFAYDIQLSDTGSLHAIASRSQEGARAFQQEYPAEKLYSDYTDLLKDPDVDVVYIATPHSHHYQWVLNSLEYGKHVLCEKPLCVNSNQVRELIKKQQETGHFLMEALWTRFLPAYVHLRRELEKHDELILSLSADFCYDSKRGDKARIYDPYLAGGSLLDIGIYPLFLALDLMGEPVDYHVTGLVEDGVDIRLTAVMQYEQGRTASLFSDVQSMSRMDGVIRMHDKVYVLPHRWHAMDYFLKIEGDHAVRHDFPKIGWGYFHEIEHVHQCLYMDLTESPVFPLSRSLQLVNYMDQFRNKIKLKYPEQIEKI